MKIKCCQLTDVAEIKNYQRKLLLLTHTHKTKIAALPFYLAEMTNFMEPRKCSVAFPKIKLNPIKGMQALNPYPKSLITDAKLIIIINQLQLCKHSISEIKIILTSKESENQYQREGRSHNHNVNVPLDLRQISQRFSCRLNSIFQIYSL